MMLRRASPDVLTVSGLAPASSTTSEHVASKPMPLTAEGGSAASAIAAQTEAAPAAPGFIHLRIVLDECIKGGGHVGRRHGIDAHPAGAPLGGERFREMVHRGLRGVVVALLLWFVDDEA